MKRKEQARGPKDIPIVVDLDGTLIVNDLLIEGFFMMVQREPLSIFLVPVWLWRGRAWFKEQIARRVSIDEKKLPYHRQFMAYLHKEFSDGRALILATASHKKYAQAIARYLGIFSEVIASDEQHNLSGHSKLKVLLEKYGEKGFDYAGNSRVDLFIFPHARDAILVGASRRVLSAAQKISNVRMVFPREDALPGGRQPESKEQPG